MEVTNRDVEVLRLVHRNRFLNSGHIFHLLGGSIAAISRRLQLLYHHGYLERPRCQLDYYYATGSRSIVYGLADKGAKVLRLEGVKVNSHRLSEKNRSVGRPYLEHVLFVAEVMTAVELACRHGGIRLVTGDELNGGAPLRWRANINEETEIGLIPDSAFALEFKRPNGSTERAYFFLEADRGTMPIQRRNLSLSSIYRKLLAYRATWQQNLHRTLFGMHRFRVLLVTATASRCQGMIDCCLELRHGKGLFLFADNATLHNPAGILSAQWRTAIGEFSTLLS